ncbi:hypothetical protein, partial [Streptococcus pneumoniae]|uniref:hypothetical protein n=1 Tax=Streptococcus pneumoniae TaxID=1313 RepID=UPI0018B04BD8
LIVFTRGEYRHQIMSVVSGDAAPTTVFKDDGIEAAQAAQGAGEVVWFDGAPPFPQDQEWFIAETIYGDRAVLRALPD